MCITLCPYRYEASMQAVVLSSMPECHKEKENAHTPLENSPWKKNLNFLPRKLSLSERFFSL